MAEETDQPPPSPRVLVDDRQDLPVDREGLADLAARCLVAEGMSAVELSLSFTTEDEIAELHERYMGESGPTDVLSFPLDGDDGEGVRMLGDVVIAPAFAARTRADLPAELRLLVVHGVLHLLGYDHEEEAERAEMWARQERYSGVAVA